MLTITAYLIKMTILFEVRGTERILHKMCLPYSPACMARHQTSYNPVWPCTMLPPRLAETSSCPGRSPQIVRRCLVRTSTFVGIVAMYRKYSSVSANIFAFQRISISRVAIYPMSAPCHQIVNLVFEIVPTMLRDDSQLDSGLSCFEMKHNGWTVQISAITCKLY